MRTRTMTSEAAPTTGMGWTSAARMRGRRASLTATARRRCLHGLLRMRRPRPTPPMSQPWTTTIAPLANTISPNLMTRLIGRSAAWTLTWPTSRTRTATLSSSKHQVAGAASAAAGACHTRVPFAQLHEFAVAAAASVNRTDSQQCRRTLAVTPRIGNAPVFQGGEEPAAAATLMTMPGMRCACVATCWAGTLVIRQSSAHGIMRSCTWRTTCRTAHATRGALPFTASIMFCTECRYYMRWSELHNV